MHMIAVKGSSDGSAGSTNTNNKSGYDYLRPAPFSDSKGPTTTVEEGVNSRSSSTYNSTSDSRTSATGSGSGSGYPADTDGSSSSSSSSNRRRRRSMSPPLSPKRIRQAFTLTGGVKNGLVAINRYVR